MNIYSLMNVNSLRGVSMSGGKVTLDKIITKNRQKQNMNKFFGKNKKENVNKFFGWKNNNLVAIYIN